MTRCNKRRCEAAVSSALGATLMVGMVVFAVAGVAVALNSIEPPLDTHKADIAIELDPGQGQWGTGDERVLLRHVGGERLPEENAHIVVSHNGASTAYAGAALGFAEGGFSYGQTWSITRTIAADDVLYVLVLAKDDRATVVLTETHLEPTGVLDCGGDLAAPVVATWQAAPRNITSSHSGNVVVTVDTWDGCSGMVGTPGFRFRLHDATDPPWTDAAMEPLGSGRFRAVVPAQAWSVHAGKTLETQVVGMTDALGNQGNSTVRSDLVDGLAGSHDPGFPYLDTDCDGLYGGSDLPIPLADVQDGVYDARPYCLVLPASTGPIAPGAPVHFRGRGIWIDVDITSRHDRLTLAGDDMWIMATDVTLDAESAERVHIETGGDIDLRRSILHSRNDRVHVGAGGTLQLDDAALEAENGPVVTASGSWTSAPRAVLRSGPSAIQMTSGASLDASRAVLEAAGAIQFWAEGDLTFIHAQLQSTGGQAVDVVSMGAHTVFIQSSQVVRGGAPDVATYPASGSTAGTPAQGTWVAA